MGSTAMRSYSRPIAIFDPQNSSRQRVVVLLPGNMCDARVWPDAMRAALRSGAVIDADLTRDDTIGAMAARALTLAAGPLLLIGFSMGGIVALEMARQAPERVCGLVLADTNSGADLPERAAVRPAQQARVGGGALAVIVADELKPNYLAAANCGDAALKTLLFDMAMGLGDAVFCRQSEALRTRADNAAVLDAFAGPVLLLVGAEDALCPPAYHKAMAARCRRPTLRIVAGAGHMLPLEQPHAVRHHLGEWLAATGLAGPEERP